MLEQTKTCLYEMKFFGMLKGIELRTQQAVEQGWSPVEFLSALIDDEKLDRNNRRTQRLLRQARFRNQAAFEDFDFTAKRNITKAQIQELRNLNFLTQARNIIITGPTGVGKTFMASAMGHQACRQGYRVNFLGLHLFVEKLTISRTEGTFLRLRDQLIKTDLLIVDDFGLRVLPPEVVQDLYDLFEERYQKKSTIITSQLPLKNWKEAIEDPVILEAILDRLVHGAIKIEMAGESYRKKKSTLTDREPHGN